LGKIDNLLPNRPARSIVFQKVTSAGWRFMGATHDQGVKQGDSGRAPQAIEITQNRLGSPSARCRRNETQLGELRIKDRAADLERETKRGPKMLKTLGARN
jgi:hypothetical protein